MVGGSGPRRTELQPSGAAGDVLRAVVGVSLALAVPLRIRADMAAAPHVTVAGGDGVDACDKDPLSQGITRLRRHSEYSV